MQIFKNTARVRLQGCCKFNFSNKLKKGKKNKDGKFHHLLTGTLHQVSSKLYYTKFIAYI